MKLPYAESVARLAERVEIEGNALPEVVRHPRYDDEVAGPSIFRLMVEDTSLQELTLPGLYVARSELRNVAFTGTDLHLSVFNWSDLIECDFTGADLTDADLRACRFVRCRFDDAMVTRANFRRSTFEECALSREQLGESMHGPGPEPEGG